MSLGLEAQLCSRGKRILATCRPASIDPESAWRQDGAQNWALCASTRERYEKRVNSVIAGNGDISGGFQMRLRTLAAVIGLSTIFGASEGLACTLSSSDFVFLLDGYVQKPGPICLSDLKKLPSVNQNVTYFAAGSVESQTFTGALLWDLLQSRGILVDTTIKNDILRKIIVVTGSDGYEAVFGAGEISPNFGGDQILIAYLVNGQSLGSSQGPTRIVAPGDKEGGRFVSLIETIDVRDGG